MATRCALSDVKLGPGRLGTWQLVRRWSYAGQVLVGRLPGCSSSGDTSSIRYASDNTLFSSPPDQIGTGRFTRMLIVRAA